MPRTQVPITMVVTAKTVEGEKDLKLTKQQATALTANLATFLGLRISVPNGQTQEDPEAYAEGDPDGLSE